MQLRKEKEDIENDFNVDRERLIMDKLQFAEKNDKIKQDLIDVVKYLFVSVLLVVFYGVLFSQKKRLEEEQKSNQVKIEEIETKKNEEIETLKVEKEKLEQDINENSSKITSLFEENQRLQSKLQQKEIERTESNENKDDMKKIYDLALSEVTCFFCLCLFSGL